MKRKINDIEKNEQEINKPETDEQEIDKPETDKQEIDKPETDKPETDEPEIDKPETDEPETKKRKKNKEEKDDICPICMNNICKVNYVITKCNHKFCFDCLCKACNSKNECPLCRANIDNIIQKKLPIFTNIDLVNNILYSFDNPYYNIFTYIGIVKNMFLDELNNYDESLTDNEKEYKNIIYDKLKNSDTFSYNTSIEMMDCTQKIINNIIISNTLNMCNWYEYHFDQ
jgi:hypothetical protein